MEENNEEIKEYVTPPAYTLGWLCIIFGSLFLLIGISDRNRIALFLGGSMILTGWILFIIGKHQKKMTKERLQERR